MALLPYQQRVVEERDDLVERLAKLCAFIGSDAFQAVPHHEQHLLVRQAGAMMTYRDVLNERIKGFSAC